MKKNSRKHTALNIGLDRRSFVRLLPAGVLAAYVEHPVEAAQQQPPAQQPQKITKEMLHTSEALIGIELTDAQESMALQGVNQNLARYETLRKIDIPLDTEPAFAFHPALPGKKFNAPPTPASRKRAIKVEVPKYGSLEEVAFFTATQLGELIRTRQVSSVELTKMYISRLKRYGPKLLCVVTLIEETALKQAAEADSEIKRGKYRGPVHGIPVGVKDLFATRGIKTTWGAEPFREQMIDYDATVVERLREAGRWWSQSFRWERLRKAGDGSPV